MTRYRYRICGIDMESPVPLSAAETTREQSSTVRIRMGKERPIPFRDPAGTPIARFARRQQGYALVRSADGYVLRVFGACELSVSADFTEAVLSMSPSLGAEFASIFLAGTLVSGLALIQSHPVLHAGAARCEGRTLAFAGHSGAGKSTLLAALCAEGARVLVDDALRIETRKAELWGYAGASELRLRPRSLPLAQRVPGATLRPKADARYGLLVPQAGVDSTRVDAVLIPELDRHVTRTELTRVTPRDALFRLLALPRLPGCIEPKARHAMFSTLAELSRHVPVAIIKTPWGPPFSERLGRDILKRVEELLADGLG